MAVPSVTFSKGETILVLPAPIPGSTIRKVKHQASFLTGGGQRIAYDKGITRNEIDLDFMALTVTQLAALESFYDDTVSGVLQTWTYIDSNGDSHTARFLEPIMEFPKRAWNIYDVRVNLELGDFPK